MCSTDTIFTLSNNKYPYNLLYSIWYIIDGKWDNNIHNTQEIFMGELEYIRTYPGVTNVRAYVLSPFESKEIHFIRDDNKEIIIASSAKTIKSFDTTTAIINAATTAATIKAVTNGLSYRPHQSKKHKRKREELIETVNKRMKRQKIEEKQGLASLEKIQKKLDAHIVIQNQLITQKEMRRKEEKKALKQLLNQIEMRRKEEKKATLPHLFICPQQGPETDYFLFYPDSTKYAKKIIDTIDSTYTTEEHVDLFTAITAYALDSEGNQPCDYYIDENMHESIKLLKEYFGGTFTIKDLGKWNILKDLTELPGPVMAHDKCTNWC